MREWPETSNFEEERCLYGREAFVIDFMLLAHQKPPGEHETVEIYALGLLKAVLKGIPEIASEIRIFVGDKYNALFGQIHPYGFIITLED